LLLVRANIFQVKADTFAAGLAQVGYIIIYISLFIVFAKFFVRLVKSKE